MSSSTNSPQRFNGTYDSFYNDAAAAASATNDSREINNRMKVPKRIRLTGDHDDSPSVNWANYSKAMPEKIHMSVPERIMVAGGESHIGSRGVPREFELEDSILPRPPDPTLYRVNTPPRTITLNHYAPEPEDEPTPSSPRSSSSRAVSQTSQALSAAAYGGTNLPTAITGYDDDSPPHLPARGHSLAHNAGPQGPGGELLSPGDELQLMRRQVGRLNRRIMALELDTQQRSHREMILYSVGVAYCIVRSVMWLNKN